jgi:hypothetical protein
MTDDRMARVERAERIARVMDRAVRVPGTRLSFGLDSLLGLIPGIGDTLALAPSLYILHDAHRAGAPRGTLARMAGNLGIDWAIGLIPLIGDIFDIGWKANARNAALLRAHVEAATDKEMAAPARARPEISRQVRA